jgi:hypothetical protein
MASVDHAEWKVLAVELVNRSADGTIPDEEYLVCFVDIKSKEKATSSSPEEESAEIRRFG